MANTTQALWIVIIALSVSCAVLLSVVIKSTYFKDKTNSTVPSEAYGGYSTKYYPPEDERKPESTTQHVSTTTVGSDPWFDFRLNLNVSPVHYELMIKPNFDTDAFQGQVNITLNLTAETSVFILHKYKNLDVFDSRVFRSFKNEGRDEELEIAKAFEFEPNEFWVVQFPNPAGVGTYILSLKFKGPLTGSIVGLYKSYYKNNQLNKTSAIVSSKFQPTFARRAFPCFDEPNWKSTYTVTLIHKKDMVALSNMPVEKSEEYDEEQMKTTFQKSVPMVTYLVCFVIGDYKYLETYTKKGTRFRVYATPDQIENAQYALDIGSHILSYFEEYFAIPYPLPKQDMVAIPEFVAGAMEHWGLITYREKYLLYNEKTSSLSNKQRVASVISHELAHMWFGNLVTMIWWDDLWLNEGFASYLEYKGVIDYEKNWDMASQFLTSDLQGVMTLDSKRSSHPIIQTVHHPDQITEIFDRISYSKGASVLRMLEAFMGSEEFRSGVQLYLNRHRYGNANTEDLWTSLTEVSSNSKELDISSIMKSWTKQKGFPIVSIVEDANNGFFATQQVFYENKMVSSNNIVDNDNKRVWTIPLTYTTSENGEELVWLNSTGPTKFLWKNPVQKDWFKFNMKQTGYYLVNYDISNWLKLQDVLLKNHEVLSPEDRSNIIHDAFRLANAGYITYGIALNMTKYLVKETHYVPWMTAYKFFSNLFDYLSTSDGYTDLKNYLIYLTQPLMNKLGWKDSGSHLDRLLRSVILKISCKCGYEPCLTEASKQFKDWMDGKFIHPNLRTRVYEFGMEQRGLKSWEYMWSKYKNETSAQEKTKLLYGLTKTRIPWLLNRLLKLAEDENNIKRQDYFIALMYVAYNPTGLPISWRYLRQNWLKLVERFTLNERYLGRAVKSIIEEFKSEFRLDEVKDFFKKYPEAGAGRRGRKQAVEEVENRIRWLKNNELTVNEWLKQVSKNI